MRAEDVADAFAWFEKVCQGSKAQEMMQYLRDRATMVHDSFTPRDSILVPSRALHNEVTITMMSRMGLECKIRLTGLRGNTSLNSKEGVIRGQDPVCEARWKARMDDGTYISVKAATFVRIGRGNYKRIIIAVIRRWRASSPMFSMCAVYMMRMCVCFFEGTASLYSL